MKILTFFLLMTFPFILCFSQDKLKVFFEHNIDTVYADTKKDISQSFKIIVPKQEKFKDALIEFWIGESDISPSEIFLPNERTIKVDNLEDTIKKDFIVKFQRSPKDDRILILNLSATDKDGKSLSLVDSNITYKLYIKPFYLDTLKDAGRNGYEFWLFTGTNVDLLDGAKLRELYFKGSYLVNFENGEKRTRSWMYMTFGKNRFFSERDSLSRISFSDIILNSIPRDSITIVNGYYNSFRETVTDNIFATIAYLYNVNELSSKESQFFINGGFYFGLQNLKTTYDNQNIISDTITYLFNHDSLYIFRPLRKESKYIFINYNIGFGITHILSTEIINVKTHFTYGLNNFYYPGRSFLNEFTSFESDRKPFVQLRIEGTVLNPGISIGFETFIRQGKPPLFNVSLTKVLDIKQLSTLFGKVPTATFE